jgi:hypothetical protein
MEAMSRNKSCARHLMSLVFLPADGKDMICLALLSETYILPSSSIWCALASFPVLQDLCMCVLGSSHQ